jgi:PAS domain S-box-containing protein
MKQTENQNPLPRSSGLAGTAALRIALIYAAVSLLWILGSDWVLKHIAGGSVAELTWLQSAKGFAYIVVATLLLYALVQRAVKAIGQSAIALRESEARYRRLIETAAEGIWVLDEQGRTVFANARMGQILGTRPEEMTEGPLLRYLKDQSRRLGEAVRRDPTKPAPPEQWELHFRRADGSAVWGIVSTSALIDAAGRYTGLLAMVMDNTQRRKAQETLRESEERFRAVFDESGIGIALCDRSGRLVNTNRALQQMLGYTADELQRLTYADLSHPDEVPAAHQDFMDLREGRQQQVEAEKRYRCKDGHFIWVYRTGSTIRDLVGNVRLVVGMVEDITERMRAREEIRQLNQNLEQRVAQRTAELQEANEQLQAFTYSVSHDLRNPLGSMQGMAHEILDKHVVGNEAGEELARRLVAATARMQRNIEDLLDYARMGRSQIPPEKVSLIVVVTQVLGQMEDEIQRRGADVLVQEPLPQVLGHRLTLVQVVTNLISNALHFVAEGKRPQVRIWAEQRGGRVRMWVQDNGIGIAPDDQQRIFLAFECAGRDRQPGTGLGLAIVRHGVHRMGGEVGVESELGKGSRFWIELNEG